MPWEEARKISIDYTVTGLDTITKLPRGSAGKPLRFVYTSGTNSERDQSKKFWLLGDFSLMRVSFHFPISQIQHLLGTRAEYAPHREK
jgi:hypothetical protein